MQIHCVLKEDEKGHATIHHAFTDEDIALQMVQDLRKSIKNSAEWYWYQAVQVKQ